MAMNNRSRLRMNGLLKQVALAALLASAAGGAFAAAGPDGGNPYSPAYGHPYRHGVIPDRAVLKLMKKWNATHSAPEATSNKTLAYGGGVSGVGVLNGHAQVYLVFYGTQWGSMSTDANGDAKFSGDSYGAAGVAQEMFKGIGTGGELWSAELTQWCQGISNGATSCPNGTPASSFIPYQSGGVLAGVWYDNTQASPSSASAVQLANEANAAAAHFGNTTAASNRFAYYVILSPHGTNPDSYQGQYCAWHDYLADAGASAPYGQLAFSNQPYNMDSGSGCGVGFVNSGSAGNLDGWTMTLGHEWHEMMSDQFPAGGWTNHQSGSYSGQENSDECAWIAAGQTGGAANVTMGTGTFTEQASWSNDTNSCAISHAIVGGGGGNVPPVANFSFTTNGLAASFTDSSTDSDGSISSRSWTFGDGGTSTSTNPSHTYASSGTYSVSLTVTDNGGATNTKTSSVTVTSGNVPPVANFSSVTNGLVANFTDSSTDSDGTIASRSWNFGDGGTSTATNPSHTYATGGTYSVSLTVTDNGGATNTKTSSVTVASAAASSVLSNGVPVTGLGATKGNQLNYTMVVPSGATSLSFAISGGSGDADLYVKFGSAPTLSSYDCRPYITGNSETCTISNIQAGTYYVMLNAYATFSGVSLPAITMCRVATTHRRRISRSTPTTWWSVSPIQSTDSDGTIASHSWNFGDGGTSTSANPSHTYSSAGTYSVSETVTDNGGAQCEPRPNP